jgi:Flp pilus assembly protein TadG
MKRQSMKLTPTDSQAYRAQATVEFSLVLPVLLLLLIGIIEASRAVFIYSSIYTASREGMRYGSASGMNAAGVPLYQDCRGIKDSAKKSGQFFNLQDSQITIQYDHGPGSAVFATCSAADGVDEGIKIASGDRILVTVTAPYAPIIPLFVPLTPKTMTSSGARTFTGVITIHKP